MRKDLRTRPSIQRRVTQLHRSLIENTKSYTMLRTGHFCVPGRLYGQTPEFKTELRKIIVDFME